MSIVQKVESNSAVGHFLVGLLTVLGVAALNYIVNGAEASQILISIGLPPFVVKFVVDLLRSSVPNV